MRVFALRVTLCLTALFAFRAVPVAAATAQDLAGKRPVETAPAPRSELESWIEEGRRYLASRARSDRWMGVARVSMGGDVLFQEAIGEANLEWVVPHNGDSSFRIGSLSKMVAAALIHRMAEAGELELNAPLGDYLPDLPVGWSAMTLQQLLNHRGGSMDLESHPDFSKWVLKESHPRKTLGRLLHEPLVRAPGSGYHYSSTGYVALAAVVERLTDRPYHDVLQERVLEPVGLRRLDSDTWAPLRMGRTSGYSWGDRGLENAPYMDMSIATGGGGLVSSAAELDQWVQALESDELFSAESRRAYFTAQAIDPGPEHRQFVSIFGLDWDPSSEDPSQVAYGNGWAHGHQHGRPVRTHGGVIYGFSGFVARFPEDDLTVVVLSNTQSYFTTLEVAKDLAALAFGREVEAPPPGPPASSIAEVAQDYAGRYQVAPGLEVEVRWTGTHLRASLAGRTELAMVARTLERFASPEAPFQITFQRDGNGEVERLQLNLDGVQVLPATRVR